MNIDADDYSSIASELMHLEQHERTVRRDLEGVDLEDYDDEDGPTWPDSSSCTDQCGLALDNDEAKDFCHTPRKSESSFLSQIPGAFLSMSPFCSASATRTLRTATTEEDENDDESLFDVPMVISYANRIGKAGLKAADGKKAWSGYGLQNQISRADFKQLQQDLETALTDVSSFLDSTTVDDTTTTTTRRKSKGTSSNAADELMWQIVVRVAERLYGDPTDNSFEAKVCRMFLARSDVPAVWKRQRLAAAAAK